MTLPSLRPSGLEEPLIVEPLTDVAIVELSLIDEPETLADVVEEALDMKPLTELWRGRISGLEM
jgi:hypothetical protein